MLAKADARPNTKFDWCAGPGKGPAGRSIGEITFRKNDPATYRFFPDVEEAALWLAANGHNYECCTQRGYLTMFWGKSFRLDGQRPLIACYEGEAKELAIWNTNAQCRFVDPAVEHEQMMEELIAGIT